MPPIAPPTTDQEKSSRRHPNRLLRPSWPSDSPSAQVGPPFLVESVTANEDDGIWRLIMTLFGSCVGIAVDAELGD